ERDLRLGDRGGAVLERGAAGRGPGGGRGVEARDVQAVDRLGAAALQPEDRGISLRIDGDARRYARAHGVGVGRADIVHRGGGALPGAAVVDVGVDVADAAVHLDERHHGAPGVVDGPDRVARRPRQVLEVRDRRGAVPYAGNVATRVDV